MYACGRRMMPYTTIRNRNILHVEARHAVIFFRRRFGKKYMP